jgi:hypothetical protein
LLPVRRLEFEVVSDAHELNAIGVEFLFQPSPIVTSLHIVLLIVYGTHNICGRKPPLRVFFVPNGTNLSVIEKTYRLFTHHLLGAKLNKKFESPKEKGNFLFGGTLFAYSEARGNRKNETVLILKKT